MLLDATGIFGGTNNSGGDRKWYTAVEMRLSGLAFWLGAKVVTVTDEEGADVNEGICSEEGGAAGKRSWRRGTLIC